MREIAPLSTLVLRSVGPSTCNPELTFGGRSNMNESKDGENNEVTSVRCPPIPDNPTLTSRLLIVSLIDNEFSDCGVHDVLDRTEQ